MTDWFLIFLAIALALRGLGAGIIFGVVLLTFPVRKRVRLIPYAQFTRELYKGRGVKVYAILTGAGALLTLALAIWTFARDEPVMVSWSIVISFVATLLGFVGTGGAFPAMRRLWKTPDKDEELVASLLGGFAGWARFSAAWHVIAFLILAVALAKI